MEQPLTFSALAGRRSRSFLGLLRQAKDAAAGRQPYRPTVAEQREVLLRHFEDSCELYGPLRGPKHMRKFGIKYARLHPQSKLVRAAFVAVKRPDHWREVLEKFYSGG
jgi:tRNA-dihydrouridine synthase